MTCDNTGELLAVKLRPGNAGANAAAAHLDVLAHTIGQVPAQHRRHLLIRGDSATATHKVIEWLSAQGQRRGRTVEYSLDRPIGEPERAAITALPTSAWSPAMDAHGQARDGAQVAELTGLLNLDGWPARGDVLRPVSDEGHQLAPQVDVVGPSTRRLAMSVLGRVSG